MIIELKGADFSANNIGKITIPKNITEDTKLLLTRFSKVFSLEQQLAVQTFVEEMNISGLMGKCTSLYLPILAGDISEAFTNIATSDYPVDVSFDSSYIVLENKGIKNLNTVYDPNIPDVTTDSVKGITLNDIHYLGAVDTKYITEEFVNNIPAPLLYIYHSKLTAPFSISKSTLKTYLSPYKANGIDFEVITGESTLNNCAKFNTLGIYGGGVYNNAIGLFGDEYSNMIPLLDEYKNSFDSITINKLSIIGTGRRNLGIPHKVISIGHGLSEEEYLKYRGYIAALLQAF